MFGVCVYFLFKVSNVKPNVYSLPKLMLHRIDYKKKQMTNLNQNELRE